MKYIAFWEFNPEDVEKVIKKTKQATEEREKGTGKFPKIIFGPYNIGGKWKGFTVYEDPTEEQLTNVMLHFMPEEKCKFMPLIDSKKGIELYMKSKK